MMQPRGNKPKPSPASPWRNAYPVAKPEPIVQHHRSRGTLVTATKLVPAVALDPITGKYPTDEKGRFPVRPAVVCRHRCTHINTRHTAFARRD